MEAICVINKRRYRLYRSDTTPPIEENKKEGNKLAKRVAPNINFECVSEYTTQLTAVFCIQVPIREMDCPVK